MPRAARFAVLFAAALILFAGAGRGFAASAKPGVAVAPPPPAVVYVFRAMGGSMVTPEMDRLAAKIEARGIEVQIHNYVSWVGPANAAIRRYKSETVKSPIIAVGHSAGGDSAIRFALWLNLAGVPVDLIVTLDPTRIANHVPGNVGRFINIYSSSHTLGGGDPSPGQDFHGHFASVDLKNYPNIWHLYMPRLPGLQDRVVDKIAEAAAGGPVAALGQTVPIEYAMPADAPLELWDSGVLVVTKAGETPAMVASQFGVPAWVVAEINKLDAAAALPAGRRLIVPRNLAPAPASN